MKSIPVQSTAQVRGIHPLLPRAPFYSSRWVDEGKEERADVRFVCSALLFLPSLPLQLNFTACVLMGRATLKTTTL